ncbi:hypothetical protein M3Y96_00550900 [Aphelenchoides besseyi]|nr:hypothetical protein M3Y96_00550900 [Aphelenchoides besseyi]
MPPLQRGSRGRGRGGGSKRGVLNKSAIAKKYSCSVCLMTYKTLIELQSHLKIGHLQNDEEEEEYEDETGQEFEETDQQNGDVEQNPEKIVKTNRSSAVPCTICGETAHSRQHSQTVHWRFRGFKGGIYLCSLCDFRHHSWAARDEHMASVHPGSTLPVLSWSKTQRNKFYCHLCPHAVSKMRSLYTHLKKRHPDVENWDDIMAAFVQQRNQQFTTSKTGPSAKKPCRVCGEEIAKSKLYGHICNVHLARLGVTSMVWLCPAPSRCDFRTLSQTERDEHVREKHPEVDLKKPLRFAGIDKNCHCHLCPCTYPIRKLLVEHFKSIHGPEAAKRRVQDVVTNGMEPSDSSSEDELQMPKQTSVQPTAIQPTSVQPVVHPAVQLNRQIKVEMMARPTLKTNNSSPKPIQQLVPLKKPKIERIAEIEQLTSDHVPSLHVPKQVPMSIPQSQVVDTPRPASIQPIQLNSNPKVVKTFGSFQMLKSIDTLISAFQQRPSVIYYDYHMLNLKYGTLPIDFWEAGDECSVLFLRLPTNEWTHEPELSGQIVTSSMLRLDAPRNTDRDAFLLGFVKPTAEDMAETLLIEANRHMTFSELVGDLIPSLKPQSILIIANDVDKKTVLEKQLGSQLAFYIV